MVKVAMPMMMHQEHAAYEWDRIDLDARRWLSQDDVHAGLLGRGWEDLEVSSLLDELVASDPSAVVTKDKFVEAVSGGGSRPLDHEAGKDDGFGGDEEQDILEGDGGEGEGEGGGGGGGGGRGGGGGGVMEGKGQLPGPGGGTRGQQGEGENPDEAAEDAAPSAQSNGKGQGKSADDYPLDPTKCYFPMYVVSGATLGKLSKLPHHEQALQDGNLIEVDRVEEGMYSNKRIFLRGKGRGADGKRKPSKEIADTMLYFFSHRWLRPSLDPELAHPDDESNTKLRALKSIMSPKKYFWIDYMCIPQRNARKQLLAIQSLPYYVHASARFTALVHGAKGKEEYLSRAWCQAELIASKLPIKMPRWEVAWLHGRGMFRDISQEKKGKEERLEKIVLGDIRDPSKCMLTDPADAGKLASLLKFAAGELDALIEWDASPDRGSTQTYGRGKTSIDEDAECRQRGISRAVIASLAERLKNAIEASRHGQ